MKPENQRGSDWGSAMADALKGAVGGKIHYNTYEQRPDSEKKTEMINSYTMEQYSGLHLRDIGNGVAYFHTGSGNVYEVSVDFDKGRISVFNRNTQEQIEEAAPAKGSTAIEIGQKFSFGKVNAHGDGFEKAYTSTPIVKIEVLRNNKF